jgi:hypothetical protein
MPGQEFLSAYPAKLFEYVLAVGYLLLFVPFWRYVQGAKRTATIRAAEGVTVLKVSSTLLEQVSASCQLRFNRVFLRSLISRLQNAE